MGVCSWMPSSGTPHLVFNGVGIVMEGRFQWNSVADEALDAVFDRRETTLQDRWAMSVLMASALAGWCWPRREQVTSE